MWSRPARDGRIVLHIGMFNRSYIHTVEKCGLTRREMAAARGVNTCGVVQVEYATVAVCRTSVDERARPADFAVSRALCIPPFMAEDMVNRPHVLTHRRYLVQ